MNGTVIAPSPFALELSSLRGLLIIDLADDPLYRTLEPQLIDGADGVGLTLLAYRHDGRVELYAEPHLQVDPSGYDGLEQGLLGIQRTTFDPARFEITDDGLKVDIGFSAPTDAGSSSTSTNTSTVAETTSRSSHRSEGRSTHRRSSPSCGCRRCPSCPGVDPTWRCGSTGSPARSVVCRCPSAGVAA